MGGAVPEALEVLTTAKGKWMGLVIAVSTEKGSGTRGLQNLSSCSSYKS